MKLIISAFIAMFTFVSVASAAPAAKAPRNPSSVSTTDDIYVCKNSQSRLTYVANRTTGVISMYEPDGGDKDNLPDRVRKMTNLKVEENVSSDDESGKELFTYTFSKAIETMQRGIIYRPVLEIEMERSKSASQVQYAEAKIMDVKITDENDIDVNLNCKSSIE